MTPTGKLPGRLARVRASSTSLLSWALGLYASLFGAMLLVAPHEFAEACAALTSPQARGLGAIVLCSGVMELVAVVFAPRWTWVRTAHALMAFALAMLMICFAIGGGWVLAGAHAMLGIGMLVAAGTREPEPGADAAVADAFSLWIGIACAVAGLVGLATGVTRVGLGVDLATL